MHCYLNHVARKHGLREIWSMATVFARLGKRDKFLPNSGFIRAAFSQHKHVHVKTTGFSSMTTAAATLST